MYYYLGILRIFHRNESVSCLYLIWLIMLIVHNVTLTFVIMSELYHFTSWFNSVVCLWILYVMSWFNPDMCYIHIIICFCHVQFCTMTAHISICFDMHNFVWVTMHIIFGFLHANLCTNDLPYYYRFLSFTSLYEWLLIFLGVFVTHIVVLKTIHIIMGFRHAHICKNDYPYYSRF